MKKNISEIAKSCDPSLYEDKIYRRWEKSGYFNPDNLPVSVKSKSYTIILPPPNVTDKLHLGHACMLTIEDLMVRFHRMMGYKTLWLPGTDHAAIATQNVVERRLLASEGKTRHDFGKEKFLEKVWEFLNETQSVILYQMKKMGSSLDWSRQAFTLDKTRIDAVQQMFINMYNEGVIYRDERIVNWCPRCKSTLADDEIEYKKNKSKFYTFKYDINFPFAIATTRPETKLGDTAVAVNPKDKRYIKYIGKTIETDFLGFNLKLKIIGDRNVEMDFGTGALGVTPAHSMIDWKMAEENNLDINKVVDENGNIHQGFDRFSGLNTIEARELIIKELKNKGLLIEEKEFDNNLACCYRCGTLIEPMPSKQWFINVDKKLERLGNKSLKERAIEVVTLENTKFTPKRFTKKYLYWMENLHNWCISRQIWFGHQIPVYYNGNDVYVGKNPPNGKNWIHDPDTLDTWFSSGMWTFSTLGWPKNYQNGKKTGDLAKFHPTQMLETGHEIITLWVSRMIIMSIFALNEIPFENVYLHGMILDKFGKKMSKTKGNGIDPLDVISKYGTDAVRLSLIIGSTPGNDIRFYEDKIDKYKNFVNKFWNIARFIICNYKINFNINQDVLTKLNKDTLSNFDRWILNKMQILIKEVTQDLKNYHLSAAGEKLYAFTWNDFADWYIEVSKIEKNENKEKILFYILTNLLKLLHPFIPFVTEEIWSYISNGKNKKDLLMISKWPKISKELETKKEDLENIELIKNIIIEIRNIRNINKIDPSKKIKAIIYCQKNKNTIKSNQLLIQNLKTGLEDLTITNEKVDIKNTFYGATSGIEIYIINVVDKEKEKIKIETEVAKMEVLFKNQQMKLKNHDFTNKAPKNIVLIEQEKVKKIEENIKKLKVRLVNLLNEN